MWQKRCDKLLLLISIISSLFVFIIVFNQGKDSILRKTIFAIPAFLTTLSLENSNFKLKIICLLHQIRSWILAF